MSKNKEKGKTPETKTAEPQAAKEVVAEPTVEIEQPEVVEVETPNKAKAKKIPTDAEAKDLLQNWQPKGGSINAMKNQLLQMIP